MSPPQPEVRGAAVVGKAEDRDVAKAVATNRGGGARDPTHPTSLELPAEAKSIRTPLTAPVTSTTAGAGKHFFVQISKHALGEMNVNIVIHLRTKTNDNLSFKM